MEQRRKFIKKVASGTTGIGLMSAFPGIITSCGPTKQKEQSAEVTSTPEEKEMFFKISLAEWSLNRSLFGGKLDNLDFPAYTKNTFGIDAVEYVNQFFKDKAEDNAYLTELKTRTDDLGITNVLIMIDGEGGLGLVDDTERTKAVENHYKWVEAAKFLGCHSIRVNAYGEGTAEEVKAAAIDGLGRLSEFGAQNNIGIIVENHGGYSSNGQWLSDVMAQVNNPICGTLPDFGNFCIKRGEGRECLEEYDKYKGVAELMPYAKGVSAKAHVFDDAGNEANMDYKKLLTTVKDAGYTGYIGIEFEGEGEEIPGINATKALLEKVGKEIS